MTLTQIGKYYRDSRLLENAYTYFLESALSCDDPEAIENLGLLYLYGEYPRRDYEKAFRYLRKAYDMGYQPQSPMSNNQYQPEPQMQQPAQPVQQFQPQVPVSPEVQQPMNSNLVADELAKLKKLLDDGVITHEEFNAQKEKLLNNK